MIPGISYQIKEQLVSKATSQAMFRGALNSLGILGLKQFKEPDTIIMTTVDMTSSGLLLAIRIFHDQEEREIIKW
ncbi:hypothetical protein [Chryseosolibacter indicus]|uniref:Uncharacterized protein n=1 Tax=Chryseosolibacter indicus TaxID=2782351 RepID=A0ABS5VW93_9BACT|nr:hypothetical protein [Chryseosolibacter indicus]MBT1705323.1 hypothetical protein [Chryseosolibacter indicus]